MSIDEQKQAADDARKALADAREAHRGGVSVDELRKSLERTLDPPGPTSVSELLKRMERN
jgi:hypothetical protein